MRLGIRVAQWTNYRWITEYSKSTSIFCVFIPRASLGLMEQACPEHFGFSSIACGLVLGVFLRPCTNGVSLPRRICKPLNKPQTTLFQHDSYFGHLEGLLVWQFWTAIPDTSLTPPQPASHPIGKWMPPHAKKKMMPQHILFYLGIPSMHLFLLNVSNLLYDIIMLSGTYHYSKKSMR